MTERRISRRTFAKGAAAAFAFTILPARARGANDRVNVACIGVGGKGRGEVSDVSEAGGNIVALCDVDLGRIAGRDDPREAHPQARFYADFRKMLDEMDRQIDAVTISTPDHTHFHPALKAIRMGKHVYCQKPLTHSIWEARVLAEEARKHGVATQMGNQAHAGEPIRRGVEFVRAGLIGKVREVHTWTNRPIWPQGMAWPPEPGTVPGTLDWDLWLGPASDRPYSSAYVPFNWRGWWDFGTGALGDMGCHIMDMPFWALDLGAPTGFDASSEGNTPWSGPLASTVSYTFAPGEYSGDLAYTWSDGGRMPPDEALSGFDLPREEIARRFDLVMIGDRGKLLFSRGRTEWLTAPGELLEEFEAPEPTIPRVANEDAEWLEACKGGPAALSNFDYSGPLTEFVLLGNLAIRLGRPLSWDSEAMRCPDAPEADPLIRREYREGWEA
jgi:predicted dehydrogenase